MMSGKLPASLSHSHRVELIEHHEISATTSSEVSAWYLASVWSDARTAAEAWADDEGLGIRLTEFDEPLPQGGYLVGVRFDVVVCKAEADPTGTEFRWRWSNRWRDWLNKFTALRRAEMFAPAHPVLVGAREADVVDLDAARGLHADLADPT